MSKLRDWGNMFLGSFGLQLKASSGSIGHPQDLLDVLIRGQNTQAGVVINDETAMRVSAVNGSVRILAETVSTLPLIIYKRLPNGGKERAENHPLWGVLHKKPNSWQSSMEFFEMSMGHLSLRGNSYALKNTVRGVTRELIPVHPDRVEVEQTRTGALRYIVHPSLVQNLRNPLRTKLQIVSQDKMFHVRGLSFNGIVGRSVIHDARETIGLAASEQIHASRVLGKGSQPSGMLRHPAKLGPETRESMEKSFNESNAGIHNSGKTIVLEEGMEWQQVGMTSQDAQFIENRRFSISDIARFFRIPLHMLQELERSTNNNIEQQSLEFVMYTLRPWLVRIEQAMSRSLFEEDSEFFAEFLVDGLLRGAMGPRFDAYESARMAGWMSVNEIRARENLNPVPDGDRMLEPMNMQEAGSRRNQGQIEENE